VKHGSVIVDIHHPAGMAAANAVNMEQRVMVDFDTFQGTTFKHGTSPKNLKSSAYQSTQARSSGYF
jgi:hypothetical protein